jgi:Fe2+ transport system protein FeoA
MSLALTPIAKPVQIRGVRGNGPIACRLMEMGLIDGARAEVIGRAPLGDPIHVRVNDFSLSLRCEDAALIDVTAI